MQIIYIHGKGGSAGEAEHYRPLFPDSTVTGFDYHAETPWEAKDEFTEYFDRVCGNNAPVILIANSIGAFFAMNADVSEKIERAYFISPIVDMERLITDMMAWAGVTEEALRQEKTVKTPFGETLSWEYLCYVRNNSLRWTAPTRILYGGKDALTSYETVRGFAGRHGAALTVMPDGEHWFHTREQMAFLDRWILECR